MYVKFRGVLVGYFVRVSIEFERIFKPFRSLQQDRIYLGV